MKLRLVLSLSALALSAWAQAAAAQFRLLNPHQGWLLTEENQLLFSNDSGHSWQVITPQRNPDERIEHVEFLRDGQHGWVLLGNLSLCITVDSGAAWLTIALPLDQRTLDNRAAVNLSFADAQHGWLAVQRQSTTMPVGQAYRTVDGGRSWSKLPDPPIYGDLRFDTSAHGALQGGAAGNQLYVTQNAGRSWTEAKITRPADVADGLPMKMVSPVFSSPSRGILLVSYYREKDTDSVTYATEDGGITWTVSSRRMLRGTTAVEFQADGAGVLLEPGQFLSLGPGEAVATRASFADRLHGWVEFHNWHGGNTFAIFYTGDGGTSFQGVTAVPARRNADVRRGDRAA